MKYFIFILILIFPSLIFAQDWSSWKNIYGIGWRDQGGYYDGEVNIAKRVKYAKQMGYDGVAISSDHAPHWINNQDKSGLKFYLLDPHLFGDHFTGNVPTGSSIDKNRAYTSSEQDWYNLNMVWKSNDPFPDNLATHAFFGTSTKFTVLWDFQQQRVIDLVIDKIITIAHSYEDTGFTLGGYMVDTARLEGEVAYWHEAWQTGVSTRLDYWTGSNSGLLHGTITHEYATYEDAMAAYYKTLNTRLKIEFGSQVKWIIQPGAIYSTTQYYDEWVYHAEQRSDYAELQPDLYIVENDALSSFLTEPNIFDSVIPINKDMVGSAVHYKSDEDNHRVLAANIGVNGAWFNWFGRFEKLPVDFASITDVWPRLKLIRCIPNWDNLAQMGTSTRSAGNEYGTISYRCEYSDGYPRSIINYRIMYSSSHWDINKIYCAVGTTTGTVTINSATRGLIRAKYVNEYFEPIATSSALADIELSGDTISWKSSAVIEPGSWTGYVLEIGTKGVSVCTY